MEFMYYELHISLENIFSYSKAQIHIPEKSSIKKSIMPFDCLYDRNSENYVSATSLKQRDIFRIWRHYLKLCKQLNSNDYLPERLLTAYNFALENNLEYEVVEIEIIRGDLNKDLKITIDDVVYLLMYTYFPSAYEINQYPDFNKDGVINTDDAIYLLMHIYYFLTYF